MRTKSCIVAKNEIKQIRKFHLSGLGHGSGRDDFFGSGGVGIGGSAPFEQNGVFRRFAYYASKLKDDFLKRIT